ncbi:aldo/keto reductase [Candidatus Enterococcus willemsii]|uniref:2,5-diketo-D-gluconic acid reductase n=1 Tax=Candidatus Enterococcus willemsii TaxID=1857215 RepID=A0ABQ6YYT2_9ENTE|nr:aldo/keto reductase [Enterococcus sp. CU12B]KAF1303000.1 2,5-diketo-D-gluconic acid reductase [Enterococcus sp. CU12B]
MTEYYQLSDGFQIPKIGFGTYSLNGSYGTRVIEQALSTGYRLIDTAFNYENEGAVGRAIKNSSVPRDQLTITSKLPGRHHDYKEALATIEESIARLGLDYIDLYLIHWPNPKQGKYVEAWQALIDAQKTGLIRSIGVSNFLPEHINRLEQETGILPVINQVELHPHFNQKVQRTYDVSKQIITEAWSPLGRASEILTNTILQEIAARYHRSVPQIILRWELQLGVLPIPKASHHARQLNNLSVFDFELAVDDMQTIASLTKTNGRLQQQDPAVYEEF